MGHRGGNKELGAVPQFGAWDQKNAGEYQSYSVVFTKAREKRKQKSEGSTTSPGDTQEESAPPRANHPHDSPFNRPEAYHTPRLYPHPYPHPNPPHPHHHPHHHQQSEPSAYHYHQMDPNSPQSPTKEDSKKKNRLLQYFGGCTRP